MKMAQYWAAQEDRWHEKYIEAEKLIDQLETKIWNQSSRIETLEAALRAIIVHCEIPAPPNAEALKLWARVALGEENNV